MGPELVRLLKRQAQQQTKWKLKIGRQRWVDTGHVLTTELGTPLTGSAVLCTVKTAAEALGLGGAVKVNVHALRHARATNLLVDGTDEASIGELLGHTDTRTTQRYLHPTPEHLRAAVERTDRRLT